MKTFSPLALVVLLVTMLTASGATVTGNLFSATGNHETHRLTFKPLDMPRGEDGVSTYAGDAITATATAGVFTVSLAQGDYRVTLDGVPYKTIRVPAGADTYNLESDTLRIGSGNVQLVSGAYKVRVNESDTNALYLAQKIAAGTDISVETIDDGSGTNPVVKIHFTGTSSAATNFAAPSGLIGLSAVPGSSTNAMRADACPAVDTSVIATVALLNASSNLLQGQIDSKLDRTNPVVSGDLLVSGTVTASGLDVGGDGGEVSTFQTGAVDPTLTASRVVMNNATNRLKSVSHTGIVKGDGSQAAAADLYSLGVSSNITDNGYSANIRNINVATNLTLGGIPHSKWPSWTNIWIEAGAMLGSTTNGAAVGILAPTGAGNLTKFTFDFDDTTAETSQFVMTMPSSWNLGTIQAKVYWTASASSGASVWGFKAGSFASGDTLGTALGTEIMVTNSITGANALVISSQSLAITVGGTPANGGMVAFKVIREAASASDTLVGDARLLGVEISYTTP